MQKLEDLTLLQGVQLFFRDVFEELPAMLVIPTAVLIDQVVERSLCCDNVLENSVDA